MGRGGELTFQESVLATELHERGIGRAPEVDRLFPSAVDGQAKDSVAFGVEKRDRRSAVVGHVVFEPVDTEPVVVAVVQRRPVGRALRGNHARDERVRVHQH